MRIFFDSTRGLVTLAVRENELRVEYLGGSVRQAMAINFVVAAFCGGLGGALVVLSLGHIEPNFSYWTTSGEFVFVAILAGWQSVAAVFVASTVLEIVRSFSSAYFPNTWQLALGLFLLFVIRFLPRGIGSLWTKRRGHDEHRRHEVGRCCTRSGVDKRFGAVVAAADITIAIRRRRARQPDRQQRRRQDDLRQHDHRLPQARRRPHHASTAATSRRSRRARSPASASRARSRSRSSTAT